MPVTIYIIVNNIMLKLSTKIKFVLNLFSLRVFRMSIGRAFHNDGAATLNLRPPTVAQLARATRIEGR